MTKEELDFIGSMNMCDEISNEAYKKIVCHCEDQQPCEDVVSRQAVLDIIMPYCQDDDGSVENTGDLRNALDDIESLPPVTPREKSEYEHDHDVIKAYNNGQAYILDKIRTEIEDIPNNENTKPIGTYDYCMGANNERKIILEIIDKYRVSE